MDRTALTTHAITRVTILDHTQVFITRAMGIRGSIQDGATTTKNITLIMNITMGTSSDEAGYCSGDLHSR